MERHGLSARQAFESLRQHARNTNQNVYDVGEAVTLSYSLFRSPGARGLRPQRERVHLELWTRPAGPACSGA
jgi:ANTAR domain